MYLNPPSGYKIVWQEPVATAALLPVLNNLRGESRVTLDTSTLYVWNGVAWVPSGIAGGAGATPLRANKHMPALATLADGALACATPLALSPSSSTAGGGYVGACINGVAAFVGDGSKIAEGYYSADGGVTARPMKLISAGDRFFWNPSIAGYPLAPTDFIDFVCEVTT